MRIGPLAALTVCAATSAGASVVHITIDWVSPTDSPLGTEVLTLDPSAGEADAGQPDFILYPLLSDSFLNSGIVFGDSSAGGLIETGLVAIGCCGVNSLSPILGDRFSPIIFNGVSEDFAPGVYTGSDGSTLVISTPEPATWALMLAGFVGLGAALRARLAASKTGEKAET